VWQTAAELEPLVLYEFMLGGPLAQGVPEVVDTVTLATLKELPYPNATFPTFPSGLFSPHTSIWHYVKVLNPDGVSEGDGGWQRLTLQ